MSNATETGPRTLDGVRQAVKRTEHAIDGLYNFESDIRDETEQFADQMGNVLLHDSGEMEELLSQER